MDTISRDFISHFPRSDVHPLSEKETIENQQRWRHQFSRPVKAATGRWIFKGLDWHVFSFKFTPCRTGKRARAAFDLIEPREVLACWYSEIAIGWRITGDVPKSGELIGFVESLRSPVDLYLSDPALQWTMVFTHEQSSGIGPFFAHVNEIDKTARHCPSP